MKLVVDGLVRATLPADVVLPSRWESAWHSSYCCLFRIGPPPDPILFLIISPLILSAVSDTIPPLAIRQTRRTNATKEDEAKELLGTRYVT